jgi:peptidoglycan/xylan/chitin deacetylase (PgdA/CDA1 family)
MRRRRDPVPRARAALHWLLGILVLGVLGGAVVSAAVLLWENVDVQQLAPGLPRLQARGPLPLPEPPLPAAIEQTTFPAVMFRSVRSQFFFPDTAYHLRRLAHWRSIVERVGGTVREVGSAQELRAVSPRELVVVPSSPCLAADEVAALQDHLRAGGSLVSNWAVGARDEACAWRGWEVVGGLTGAVDVREIGPREAVYLTIPAGTPLSPGLDPGTRVELIPETPLALYLTGPRVYWSDWALNPAPDESGGGADVAALTARTDEGGRISWFGFRLSHAATPRDSVLLERLVTNGVQWAAGVASASPAPWPGGSRAALTLVQDVEAEYLNATAMVALLREEGTPGTFYPVSQMVVGDDRLADLLLAVGEVGSQTTDHQPLLGMSRREQDVRLRRSWTEIRDWAGVRPAGLRPPEEAFDHNTLRSWRDAGGTYVLAVNEARSGGPEIHSVLGGQIVLIPRLIKDDYNVFVQEGAIRADPLTDAFLEGIGKMRAMGGLAVIATHTQIVGTGRRLDAVRAVIRTARAQRDWWVATASDVASWWSTRRSVRVTMLSAGDLRSLSASALPDSGPAAAAGSTLPGVLVEAPDHVGISGLWVNLVLPVEGASVAPYVDGLPVSYSMTDWGIRFPVGDLSPGEARIIHLGPSQLQDD